MPAFIFYCPNMHVYVHGWSEDETGRLDVYETVECPACTGTHMVNPRTGRVIGADEKSQE